MWAVKQITPAVLAAMCFFLFISRTASANLSEVPDRQMIFYYPDGRLLPESYRQNSERRYSENPKTANSPLTLTDWQLVTNPRSIDKSMNKHVVGTVKNNSQKEFSEIKIEFTVYDEDGNQIAIVSSNQYDFRPGGIWIFEIPVTEDVKKAEFKGLYVLP